MPLQKQPININFIQGLDTKTDPFQVSPGKFLTLQNSIFDKGGRLTKRNGYSPLGPLPDETSKFVTTFNNNLTAIGTSLLAYSSANETWINKGHLQPIDLSVLPLYRSNTNQTQADSAIATNGLVCTVFTNSTPSGVLYQYVIADSVTGQNIVPATTLNGAVTYGTPRVFLLNSYFIIVYTTEVGGTYHLTYIAISTSNPSVASAPADLADAYTPSTTVAFDCLVVDSRLFYAYNTTSGGQAVVVRYLSPSFVVVTPAIYTGEIATMFSLTADNTTASNPTIYVSYYNLPTTTAKVLAVDINLNTILAPTTWDTADTILNLASTAQNGSVEIYSEIYNTYTYNGVQTDYINKVNVTQSGTVGAITVLVRDVGLASKAFLYNGTPYVLTVQDSEFQPTYFLINSLGQVVSELAYENAGPYYLTGLPNYSEPTPGIFSIPYLYKDLVQAVNKTQGAASAAGVYAQLGVNLSTFDFTVSTVSTAEIGNNLNISGGFINAYDGVAPVEQGFFLWPENIFTTTTSGSMAAQEYFYQVTYEWADNQGNLFRSAPSVPLAVTLGSTGGVTLYIPTLRLTYKITNPVKIVIYRWSEGQQIYYQVTSITEPLLNNPTVDFVTYTDTQPDSAIIGNNIIYTTGGVLEDIGPPASNLLTLFNNRLWLVDSEDRNLLWFSKQVIESVPVEMSDLLTLYVAPTTGSEGSTGPITAIAPMDDKLVIFKANALGYINGTGPDNTGSNNQYSDFTLINSVVGCTNQLSIVFTPNGLMFQSNKGIWLLGRDLSTNYIGAPVELLTTGATVQSALNIPMTNQVRFTLDTGITLMYDYYYNQWGTFINVPAISSTIYQSLHTYINALGQVFQEDEGSYLDNSSPVLMAFTTSWIAISGIQGFERFYQMYLLGEWLTPFKLNVQLAYDFNNSMVQSTIVTPEQSPSTWGSQQLWGSGSTWGSSNIDTSIESSAAVFKARVFPQRQKCESFQVSVNELYDSQYGTIPGAGLTLSGLDLVCGMKRGFRTARASRSFG